MTPDRNQNRHLAGIERQLPGFVAHTHTHIIYIYTVSPAPCGEYPGSRRRYPARPDGLMPELHSHANARTDLSTAAGDTDIERREPSLYLETDGIGHLSAERSGSERNAAAVDRRHPRQRDRGRHSGTYDVQVLIQLADQVAVVGDHAGVQADGGRVGADTPAIHRNVPGVAIDERTVHRDGAGVPTDETVVGHDVAGVRDDVPGIGRNHGSIHVRVFHERTDVLLVLRDTSAEGFDLFGIRRDRPVRLGTVLGVRRERFDGVSVCHGFVVVLRNRIHQRLIVVADGLQQRVDQINGRIFRIVHQGQVGGLRGLRLGEGRRRGRGGVGQFH